MYIVLLASMGFVKKLHKAVEIARCNYPSKYCMQMCFAMCLVLQVQVQQTSS